MLFVGEIVSNYYAELNDGSVYVQYEEVSVKYNKPLNLIFHHGNVFEKMNHTFI